MVTRLHDMVFLEDIENVGDILPAFANVKNEVHVGEPNKECAGCRKPFTLARKARKNVRIYPMQSILPICFSFRICGSCLALHEKGGADRDAVLSSVQAFCEGDAAKH